MGKIYLIGDTHIALGYPNKSDKWLKIHKQYFEDFLLPFLKKNVNSDDIIIHLGDLFDNRDIIPIEHLNFALRQVEKISEIAPFHIIVGNHDSWSRSSGEINAIQTFKHINNVFIHDKVEKIDFEGYKLLVMPYFDDKNQQIKYINENKDCDFLFCHSDLNGAKMHLTSSSHKIKNKVDIEDFKPFKRVYAGHIHIVQKNKNFTFVGSNFQMDRNDYYDQKGIFVYEPSTDEEKFIENNISPVFNKIKVLEEESILKLEELKNTDNYIDIEISNNLLVKNRKLRRKLEILLEKGNFASIEYIDDIKDEEDEKIDEDVDNNFDISINLDYEEYIKEYIENQNYKTKKFKKNLLEEYLEIVKIYKNNYKLNKNEYN